jgi:hypothetical protein
MVIWDMSLPVVAVVPGDGGEATSSSHVTTFASLPDAADSAAERSEKAKTLRPIGVSEEPTSPTT